MLKARLTFILACTFMVGITFGVGNKASADIINTNDLWFTFEASLGLPGGPTVGLEGNPIGPGRGIQTQL